MKKQFHKPNLQVIKFESTDIICGSLNNMAMHNEAAEISKEKDNSIFGGNHSYGTQW